MLLRSISARFRGFTLLELLVVLATVGLLVGLMGPWVMRPLGALKTNAARVQLDALAATLGIYRLEVGRYPTTAEGLRALVEAPSDAEGWNGPYVKKLQVPQDPWGFDYRYRSPGRHWFFDIWSLGADNREGGEGEDQDVYGWE